VSRFPFELRHHGDRISRHGSLANAVAEMRRRIKRRKKRGEPLGGFTIHHTDTGRRAT
jgi:hypothetical protein